jgi:hypothetical protein
MATHRLVAGGLLGALEQRLHHLWHGWSEFWVRLQCYDKQSFQVVHELWYRRWMSFYFTWTQRERTSAKQDSAFGGYKPCRAGSASAPKASMSWSCGETKFTKDCSILDLELESQMISKHQLQWITMSYGQAEEVDVLESQMRNPKWKHIIYFLHYLS